MADSFGTPAAGPNAVIQELTESPPILEASPPMDRPIAGVTRRLGTHNSVDWRDGVQTAAG